MIVNEGLRLARNTSSSTGFSGVVTLAVGQDSVITSVEDTSLNLESGRVAFKAASTAYDSATNTMTTLSIVGAGIGNGTVAEVGTFDSTGASSGTMFSKVSVNGTTLTKANDEEYKITRLFKVD